MNELKFFDMCVHFRCIAHYFLDKTVVLMCSSPT